MISKTPLRALLTMAWLVSAHMAHADASSRYCPDFLAVQGGAQPTHRGELTLSPYTGKLISSVKLKAAAYLPPIVAGGTVYLLTDDGKLNAYR